MCVFMFIWGDLLGACTNNWKNEHASLIQLNWLNSGTHFGSWKWHFWYLMHKALLIFVVLEKCASEIEKAIKYVNCSKCVSNCSFRECFFGMTKLNHFPTKKSWLNQQTHRRLRVNDMENNWISVPNEKQLNNALILRIASDCSIGTKGVVAWRAKMSFVITHKIHRSKYDKVLISSVCTCLDHGHLHVAFQNDTNAKSLHCQP